VVNGTNIAIAISNLVGGPGRQYTYELTKKGEDLLPLLAAMMQWSARHNPHTVVSPALRKQLEKDFSGVVESFRAQVGAKRDSG
jgi:hypothetical protein